MLELGQLEDLVIDGLDFKLSKDQIEKVHSSHQFLQKFSKDKVIYGINTGFGPMAQYKINEADVEDLQYNLVRSHAQGVGEPLSPRQTRAVMICRVQTLALGYSGASADMVEVLVQYINHKIYPLIPKHGGVGASGDLVQLAHLALGLIGEGDCYYNGDVVKVADALKAEGLTPAKLSTRDGLSLLNGTSCMSGIAATNLFEAENLIRWSVECSAMMNELTASYSDSFSEPLNNSKLHEGQRHVAKVMREVLENGNLKSRDEHLFDNKYFEDKDHFAEKVQEYYSLRCVPQIIGPIYDTFLTSSGIVENEINSANDNPIVSEETINVYHGGNFHGDYISLEMDKLRLAVVKLSMLMERQTNYLLNAKLNDQFPPFLNSGRLGINFGLQGMQFTAVSTTAENQMLANSMYVHSIPNNGDNQDIVSMGTNSALMTEKVINNTYEVLAIQLTCLAQALDLHGEREKFSVSSQNLYDFTRQYMTGGSEDVPRKDMLDKLVEALKATKKKMTK